MRTVVTKFPTDRPKAIVLGTTRVTVVFPVLIALPTLWPQAFPFLSGVKIDTDPENMISCGL